MDNVEEKVEANIAVEEELEIETVGVVDPVILKHEEVLPAMTMEEIDAFFNAEDEFIKEDRNQTPVAEQLDENGSLS